MTWTDYVVVGTKTYDPATGEVLDWFVVDLTTLDSIGRYMEYEIKFKGSTSFESPAFAGVEYDYYEPGRFTLFFQPMEINRGSHYVGEILFTHEGTVPETSTLEYGITHGESVNLLDFSSVDQPAMHAGTAGIVLSRFNEKTTTVDYKKYTAINGRWNDSYEISVYRVSPEKPLGELVSASFYSEDSKTGSITFSTVQPTLDEFNITVTLKPYFRVIIDMKNYSSDTVVLDNVGFLYNLVDRDNLSEAGDHRDVTSVVTTNYYDYANLVAGSLFLEPLWVVLMLGRILISLVIL